MGSSNLLGMFSSSSATYKRFYAFGLVVEEGDARPGDCTA